MNGCLFTTVATMRSVSANPDLAALLEKSRLHVMSPEEKETQRQNWVRGEMAIGTDADEERWKQDHGY